MSCLREMIERKFLKILVFSLTIVSIQSTEDEDDQLLFDFVCGSSEISVALLKKSFECSTNVTLPIEKSITRACFKSVYDLKRPSDFKTYSDIVCDKGNVKKIGSQVMCEENLGADKYDMKAKKSRITKCISSDKPLATDFRNFIFAICVKRTKSVDAQMSKFLKCDKESQPPEFVAKYESCFEENMGSSAPADYKELVALICKNIDSYMKVKSCRKSLITAETQDLDLDQQENFDECMQKKA